MKIKISKISEKCYLQKGFDDRGCYGCDCNDSCCRYGADFDLESYKLVVLNKNLIEPLIGIKVDKCFEKKFSNDQEFLGKNSIRSLRAKNGFCVFHNKRDKGCILYELVGEKGLDRRIIPSICRLFPLTWADGELIVYDEQKDARIPGDCNCMEKRSVLSAGTLETQRKEINDIFDIDLK